MRCRLIGSLTATGCSALTAPWLDTEPGTVLWNVADEMKTGELDEFVLNAGNSYELVAPENHTPVAEEMEVSSAIFSVRNFLHLVLKSLHLLRSCLKGNGKSRGTNLQIERTPQGCFV